MNNKDSGLEDVQLSKQGSVELRSDVVSDGSAYTWDEASEVFQYSMELSRNQGSLLGTKESGSSLPYSPESDKRELDRIEMAEVGLKNQNPLVYTYEFRLAGNPVKDGEWMAPVDFTQALLESWSDVRQTAYDKLGDAKYQYMRLFDATSTGHPCVRVILQTTAELTEEACEAIIQSHTDNSSVASDNDHLIDRCVTSDRSVNLKGAVDKNLSVFAEDRDGSWQDVGFHTLLWSMNEPRFLFSESAKEHFGDIDHFSPEMVEIEG